MSQATYYAYKHLTFPKGEYMKFHKMLLKIYPITAGSTYTIKFVTHTDKDGGFALEKTCKSDKEVIEFLEYNCKCLEGLCEEVPWMKDYIISCERPDSTDSN